MLEKEMEDLIANYPDDFFPGKHLELVEKQKRILDVGEFNIFFRDESGEKVLIKIITRAARIGDSAQWSHYKENLKKFGYENMDVWLIALHISPDMKRSFDQIGMVSFEIGESKLQQVSERHHHEFKNDEEQSTPMEQFNKSNCGDKIQLRLKKGFKDRLKSLERTFPAAYSFLNYPYENRYFTNISLTTDVNAHLHFGRYFLAYIVIHTDEGTVEFIPHPNLGNLPGGAIDGHPIFFSGILPPLVAKFHGMEEGWVKQDKRTVKKSLKLPVYIFTRDTPNSFFTSLISAIENLDCKEMAEKYPFMRSS